MSITHDDGYPFSGYDGSDESFDALLDARPPPEPGSDAEFDLMASGPAGGNHPEERMTVTGTRPEAPWREMIPADRLHPSPHNPRKDPGDLAGLRESILAEGLEHRLTVSPAPDIGPDHYRIRDGWRRYLAMQDDWSAYPCEIRPLRAGDPAAAHVITALVTDIHKKALNPMERAEGLEQLRKLGMTGAEMARRTGLSQTVVANSLILLTFSDEDREKIRTGKLPVTVAQKIARQVLAKQRKKAGKPARGTRWQPDHFTAKHQLARIAAAMCDAREHNSHRRRGGACDYCWEDAIRADQRRIDEATYQARDRFANAMAERDAEAGDSGRPEDQEVPG